MTTYLGKSCSFCLPRVPFVNCRQFMYLVISLLVFRAGYGIWLYQFLIIAYLFTLLFLKSHSNLNFPGKVRIHHFFFAALINRVEAIACECCFISVWSEILLAQFAISFTKRHFFSGIKILPFTRFLSVKIENYPSYVWSIPSFIIDINIQNGLPCYIARWSMFQTCTGQHAFLLLFIGAWKVLWYLDTFYFCWVYIYWLLKPFYMPKISSSRH